MRGVSLLCLAISPAVHHSFKQAQAGSAWLCLTHCCSGNCPAGQLNTRPSSHGCLRLPDRLVQHGGGGERGSSQKEKLLSVARLALPRNWQVQHWAAARASHSAALVPALHLFSLQWALPASAFEQQPTICIQTNDGVMYGPAFSAGGYGWCVGQARSARSVSIAASAGRCILTYIFGAAASCAWHCGTALG